MVNARVLTDLAFCASTLEPLATRVSSFASALRPHLALMDAHFARSRWWYGGQWSIVNAYLHWVWLRAAAQEVAASSHQYLARHDAAMRERPAVHRAPAINHKIAECLAARAITPQVDNLAANCLDGGFHLATFENKTRASRAS